MKKVALVIALIMNSTAGIYAQKKSHPQHHKRQSISFFDFFEQASKNAKAKIDILKAKSRADRAVQGIKALVNDSSKYQGANIQEKTAYTNELLNQWGIYNRNDKLLNWNYPNLDSTLIKAIKNHTLTVANHNYSCWRTNTNPTVNNKLLAMKYFRVLHENFATRLPQLDTILNIHNRATANKNFEAKIQIPTSLDKDLFLQMINNYRRNGRVCGSRAMPPTDTLAWNNVLEKISKKQTESMFRLQKLTHTDYKGNNVFQRALDLDYWNSALYESLYWNSELGTEEEAIESWTDHTPTCLMIMDAKFKEIGVTRHGGYWTQVLGTRK